MTSSPTLGMLIRQRRLELGLTQEALAERIGAGVRQAEISRLEHDRVTLPRKARLENIARALDLSVGTLLVRSGWAGVREEFGPVASEAPRSAPEPPASGARGPERAAQPKVLEPEMAPELSTAITRSREIIERTRAIMRESQTSYDRANTVSACRRQRT